MIAAYSFSENLTKGRVIPAAILWFDVTEVGEARWLGVEAGTPLVSYPYAAARSRMTWRLLSMMVKTPWVAEGRPAMALAERLVTVKGAPRGISTFGE